jgi:hypothetical protein
MNQSQCRRVGWQYFYGPPTTVGALVDYADLAAARLVGDESVERPLISTQRVGRVAFASEETDYEPITNAAAAASELVASRGPDLVRSGDEIDLALCLLKCQ